MDKKSNDSQLTTDQNYEKSNKNSYDLNWIKHTNAQTFLAAQQQHIMKKPVTDHDCQKHLSKYNGIVNRMAPDQVNLELRKLDLSTSGSIEIRRVRLKHFHKAKLTLGNKNPLDLIEQHFEFIAVIDFEATCDRNNGNHFPHEIIEFPVVLIDVAKRAIVERFQSFCRPVLNPVLTDFCTELTGIEQHQVDAAPVFADVLRKVESWLADRNLIGTTNKRKCGFATDGPWDFAKFLQLQCQISEVPYPRWARKWINVRKEFASFYTIQRCGINKMLENLGLSFDGRHHSGLDDSVNIARIAIELIQDGCVLMHNDAIRSGDPKFIDLNSDRNFYQTQNKITGAENEADENENNENILSPSQDDFDD